MIRLLLERVFPWQIVALVMVQCACGVLLFGADYDQPPISYSSSTPEDPVSLLTGRMDKGEVTLAYDPRYGYLPALLQALKVPASSQTLVFSKTSLQKDVINPQTPRALYYNDEVYVGTCVGGATLEVAAVDPRLGPVFYVLEQEKHEHPRLQRKTDECLQCHDSRSFTGGVPGLMMRSVYPDEEGQPRLALGSFVTDQESAWQDRWGGWYVTGTYGKMRHLGNLLVSADATPERIDREPGANQLHLAPRIEASDYLRDTSDVVALMVLGHQTQMHNRITTANYETRMAQHYEAIMRKALSQPDYVSDSSLRRIASAGEDLLKYLLFCNEPRLTQPVIGSQDFARDFMAHRPHDAKGRSLYQLDLSHRLLRYPCSYLIYSPSFASLPQPMLEYLYKRLRDILSGVDHSPDFAHLTPQDRQDIHDILVATVPAIDQAWKN